MLMYSVVHEVNIESVFFGILRILGSFLAVFGLTFLIILQKIILILEHLSTHFGLSIPKMGSKLL